MNQSFTAVFGAKFHRPFQIYIYIYVYIYIRIYSYIDTLDMVDWGGVEEFPLGFGWGRFVRYKLYLVCREMCAN